MAGWMIDPLVCAGMTMGSARVDLSALIELKRLVTGGDKPAHFRGGDRVAREEDDETSQNYDAGLGSADEPDIRNSQTRRTLILINGVSYEDAAQQTGCRSGPSRAASTVSGPIWRSASRGRCCSSAAPPAPFQFAPEQGTGQASQKVQPCSARRGELISWIRPTQRSLVRALELALAASVMTLRRDRHQSWR